MLLAEHMHKAGNRFHCTGGGHISGDDFQIALVMKENEAQLEELNKEKKKRLEAERIDSAAKELLAQNIAPSNLKKDQLIQLLLWRGIAKKDLPKTNQKRLEKWIELKDTPAPSFQKWTDEDETRITKLTSHEIRIEDTAIGRQKKVIMNEFKLLFKGMSKEERLAHIEACEKMDTTLGGEISGPSVSV